jgi:hypothetical protein
MEDGPAKKKCTDCPFLRMAARAERMMECGIIPTKEEWAGKNRVAAIHVGVERDERGCAGPVRGKCRFSDDANMAEVSFDPNVPLLKRRVDDGQDHFYH